MESSTTSEGLLARLGQQAAGEESSSAESLVCPVTEMWRSCNPEMKCSPSDGGGDHVFSATCWSFDELPEIHTADGRNDCSSSIISAASSGSAPPPSTDCYLVSDELDGLCSTMQGSKLKSFNAKVLRKNRNGRVVNIPGRSRMVLHGSSGAGLLKNNIRGGVMKPTRRHRRSDELRASWIIQRKNGTRSYFESESPAISNYDDC